MKPKCMFSLLVADPFATKPLRFKPSSDIIHWFCKIIFETEKRYFNTFKNVIYLNTLRIIISLQFNYKVT